MSAAPVFSPTVSGAHGAEALLADDGPLPDLAAVQRRCTLDAVLQAHPDTFPNGVAERRFESYAPAARRQKRA